MINLDWTEVVSFIVGVLCTGFSVYVAFQKAINKLTLKFTQEIAVIKTQISELEKKVDKHNNIVERTYQNEADIKVLLDEREQNI